MQTDLTYTLRPTVAEIDLSALEKNFRSVKRHVGSEVKYMAVVKANGYGHGAVECARTLEAAGVDWLAVALVEEGVELRNAGIELPILCLGSFWPGQEQIVLDRSLTPVILHIGQANLLDQAATESGIIADYHLKIDTGMGRVGIPYDQIGEVARELSKFKSLRLDGVMTHFAVADDLSRTDFTNTQIQRFTEGVAVLRECGFAPEHIDLANSPAAIAHPNSLGTMVRLGGILYGLGDDVLPKGIEKPELVPVMSLKTRVAQIKSLKKGETVGYGQKWVAECDSIIATIPIGYHDGYRRGLSNTARALIRGTFVPIAGTISMDWTTLDVTELSEVSVGDEVTVVGSDGEKSITAENLAKIVGTISYEITCGIGERVPRKYLR